MKVIIKDINNPKSEIPKQRISEIKNKAASSLLPIALFTYGIFKKELNYTAASHLFTTKSIYYLFLVLLFIVSISGILRFLFMILGKNFSFINDNVFIAILSVLLLINFGINFVYNGFDMYLLIFPILFIGILIYNLIKENKYK